MAVKRKKSYLKRRAQRAKPKSNRTEGRSLDQVRVRMYCQGLGECFLLTFPRLGVPFHMLIDCGLTTVLRGASDKMKWVASDIRAVTAGRLDVLVVTHRHWDKLSGFLLAQEIFDKMEVGQVWLGWTEDPDDPVARELAETRNAGLGRNDEAMEYVRHMGQRVQYWRGGQGPIAISGVPGARVFFLGPPSPKADLRRAQAAIAASESITSFPFIKAYQIRPEVAKKRPEFASYFGNLGTRAHNQDTSDDSMEWRQIGAKSVNPIPPLRLDLPYNVNDTSVVMAIELAGVRGESKVLLFPGDAQLASWFSWHEHRWPQGGPSDDPKTITCRKLLDRTALYKVSHYGSRTGTPIQFGLDMMNSPDLVAMLVVDEITAKAKRWQLPAPDLMTALDRKTRGRIIRSDLGSLADLGKGTMLSKSKEELDRLQRAVHLSKGYIDYFVTTPQLTSAEREASAANWSAANERRVYLVDKKLAGTIKPEEESELREIEQLMDEYLNATAPTGSGLLMELRDTVERAKGPGER